MSGRLCRVAGVLGAVAVFLVATAPGASADAWSALTTDQQGAVVDGLQETLGFGGAALYDQSTTSLGIAGTLSGCIEAGPACATVQSLNAGELDYGLLEGFVDSGLTAVPTTEVGGLSGAALGGMLDPVEMDFPGVGTAVAAVGVLQIGDSLWEQVTGPSVTVTPGAMTGLRLCLNSEVVLQGAFPTGTFPQGAGECNTQPLPPTSDSEGGLLPCIGSPSGNASAPSPFSSAWEGEGVATGSQVPGAGCTDAAATSVGQIDVRELGALVPTYAAQEQISGGSNPGWFAWFSDCWDQPGEQLGAPFLSAPGHTGTCYYPSNVARNGEQDASAAFVEPASDFTPSTPFQAGAPPAGVPVTKLKLAQSGVAPSQLAAGAQSMVNDSPAVQTLVNSAVANPMPVVPDCYDPWPVDFKTCDQELVAQGLQPVNVTDGSGAYGWSYWSADGDGAVEGTSSTASPTYTEADGVTLAKGTKVYVVVNEPGSTVPGGLPVPSCAGVTVPACESAFQQAGFTATPTVTWDNGASTNTPVGNVITVSPAQGMDASMPADTPIAIDGAGLVVPAPAANEVYTQYQTELVQGGFPGGANATITVLDPFSLDPFQGANSVVTVSPAPGHVLDPSAAPGQAFKLSVNPDPMPYTGTGTGTTGGTQTGGTTCIDPTACATADPFTGPTIDPNKIEFPNVPTPCNVFPFGVPCWLYQQVQQFNAAPVAPSGTITTPYGNISIDLSNVDGVDFGQVMAYARPIMLFMCFAGWVLWLARRPPPGFDSNDDGEQGQLF